jgi:hypothetical protein
MILKGFRFVAFFAGVKVSSFCIHLSCPVCSLSVVCGEWSRLFCGLKGRNLPEVSIASFLLPQFFVSVRLSDPYKNVGKTKMLYNFKIVSVLTFLKIVLLIVPMYISSLGEIKRTLPCVQPITVTSSTCLSTCMSEPENCRRIFVKVSREFYEAFSENSEHRFTRTSATHSWAHLEHLS